MDKYNKKRVCIRGVVLFCWIFTWVINVNKVSANEIGNNEVNYHLENRFESYQSNSRMCNEYLTYSVNKKTKKYLDLGEVVTFNYPASNEKLVTFRTISQYSYKKSTITETEIEQKTGKYACGVVALTQIAYQEGANDKSLKKTFDKIWNHTTTKVLKKTKKVTYGTTLDNDMAKGMKKYCEKRGYKCKTSTKVDPEVAFFVGAVNKNYSSTLSLRIKLINGDITSHCVSVVGYLKTKVSGKTKLYLIVADGWNAGFSYIDYNNIDFVNTYGVVYNIHK